MAERTTADWIVLCVFSGVEGLIWGYLICLWTWRES